MKLIERIFYLDKLKDVMETGGYQGHYRSAAQRKVKAAGSIYGVCPAGGYDC